MAPEGKPQRKARQLVVRVDPWLEDVIEDEAARQERSRAVIVCAGVMLFEELDEAERDEAVRRYLRRRREAEPPQGGPGKSRRPK
ncbi:MAG TPA: hypothetical protein VHF22_00715 [Planctomycetota bacterium]|nr:hypothetical protein [Planctomycetota bacterium]